MEMEESGSRSLRRDSARKGVWLSDCELYAMNQGMYSLFSAQKCTVQHDIGTAGEDIGTPNLGE